LSKKVEDKLCPLPSSLQVSVSSRIVNNESGVELNNLNNI
jgi:hypothetical protein